MAVSFILLILPNATIRSSMGVCPGPIQALPSRFMSV